MASRSEESVVASAAGTKPRAGRKAQTDAQDLAPEPFRQKLMEWYRLHARDLPWRGTTDPYEIWVSEIMLQQTRVAAVIEHYNEFLRRFPTLMALSLADEREVLAAWSGLGYYRRARMLHKAAQFIVTEREGRFPGTAALLRTLPGIGEYTAAAIASIAFGESVAVVDGNVERVILRLTGKPNEATAATKTFVRDEAQKLMPVIETPEVPEADAAETKRRPRGWDADERIALAAAVRPRERAGGDDPWGLGRSREPGDHNQAMMELGAMICVPKAPLCMQCPVYDFCKTRGEHRTPSRTPQRSRPVAFLLELRKKGTVTEVLLAHRAADASLMPAMYELPSLPMEAVEGREPVLRVRHAITNTNYYVQVYTPDAPRREDGLGRQGGNVLRRAVPNPARDLLWVPALRLPGIPITGLARKILQRLNVMESARMNVLE
ncbi:MAG TPA: A/G-specific adenine glycosylase [Acidobacteriaceae bacterium]|nr:A/G-specific adenine glycosylase [Acidobacteriaceae bacterium]